MSDANVLLSVEHLSKRYYIKRGLFSDRTQYVHAVDDVSLSLKRGQSLGLVGESGCGKSTLGKTILRLVEPDSGRVVFDDKIIFDSDQQRGLSGREMRSLRRKFGMIFQDPYSSLNPKRTIGSAVEEAVVYHHVVSRSEAKAYCIEVLARCGLPATAYDLFPAQFSGGQRQRAVIARALALKPDLLVCDEPTAALDVSIQSQILNLMLDMKEEYHLTYLFISHNLGVTRFFCDEIAVMYLGKIVELGPAGDVYSSSMHPYTSALIASLPISTPGEEKERPHLNNELPSMMNIPKGCRFHTRCPYAMKQCEDREPVLAQVKQGHWVACHLWDTPEMSMDQR